MKPIGLTMKDVKYNPFTGRTTSELMIVHSCVKCGKISCNRIAGDDYSEVIISLLDESINNNSGIHLLNRNDTKAVLACLYGY